MFPRRRRFPSYYPSHFPSPYGFLPSMYPKRQYPEVSTALFVESAKVTKPILIDITKLLDKIEDSPSFSKELMDAAQQSNKTKVLELVSGVGMKSRPEVDFNPDGFKMIFRGKSKETDCCIVNLALRWR